VYRYTEKCVAAVGDRINSSICPFRGGIQRTREPMVGCRFTSDEFRRPTCAGLWIAPLDHDDEFVPDHVKRCWQRLGVRNSNWPMESCSAITPDGRDNWEIGVFPPRLGEFGFQGAIHPTALRFFEYKPKSWIVNEPETGIFAGECLKQVSVSDCRKVVTRYYPGPFGLAPRIPRATL